MTFTNAASIREVFKLMLMKNLGKDWYTLAVSMGLPRTPIDAIEEQGGVDLVWKINSFLHKYNLPSFQLDVETAEFLVETLQRVSLHHIAEDVRRDLKNDLHLEGTHSASCNECPYLFVHITKM